MKQTMIYFPTQRLKELMEEEKTLLDRKKKQQSDLEITEREHMYIKIRIDELVKLRDYPESDIEIVREPEKRELSGYDIPSMHATSNGMIR